jgi:GNAT superfamily N-acetyltransferase
VLPRQRRRGIGSAILGRLEDHARADDRAMVQASTRWAMEHGPEGSGSPGVEFARKHGYPVRLVEAERRLALPVCAELLDELSARAVAIAPDGELAGYTDIVVRSENEPAEQWGTLVRRAHRGHGLGCGLKAAVIRLLQQERPEISATITSNALTNTAMVAVNDRLGYEIIEYLGDVQKRL